MSSIPNDLTGGPGLGNVGNGLGIDKFKAQGCGTIAASWVDDGGSRLCSPYSQLGDVCGGVCVGRERGEETPISSSCSMSIFSSSSSSSNDLLSRSMSSKSVEES